MCVVSMVGDHYQDKWDPFKDWAKNQPQQPINPIFIPPGITRDEFNQLKKEVEDMKELLKKAVEYDKKNNEPHCEMEEKIEMLKKMATLFNVNLDEIFNIKNK